MICAVYHRAEHRLVMTGHAYSGEPGKDLVCAAASAIAYSLAVNVDCLMASGQAKKGDAELVRGRADIAVTPTEDFEDDVTLIFDAVCLGMAGLAHTYPQYIRYEIR